MMNGRVSLVILAVLLASCGGGDTLPPCCESLPASGLYATFRVGEEYFQASITNPDGMSDALALCAGTSNARIPNALLVCMPVPWNAPWSWYMDPEGLRFAEVTVEVCDALPSYIDANCESLGRYCPWGASMVDLRDSDAGSACPRVKRS